MLLAIDVGNTQTVLGLFDGESLAEHRRLATDASRTGDELGALLLTPVLFFSTRDPELLLLLACVNAVFSNGQFTWMPAR